MPVVFDSMGAAAIQVVAPSLILALMKALLPFHAMAGAITVPAGIVVGRESQTGEDH
jgi:hypothetical protein